MQLIFIHMRPSNRTPSQLRQISIETNVNKHAEGSCLVKFGDTHVLCLASLEERVPPFLRNKGTGWVSAEYSMLPRATNSRNSRDNNGKPNGRALEIQRLIARSLRSTIDLSKLGERQITIDCDVLQADGGTRCAAITGGYVALALAIKQMLDKKIIKQNPLIGEVCAISCGVYKGQIVADLDYLEDSQCEVDANFVINQNFDLIEVQGTAEKGAMSFDQLSKMHDYAKKSAEEIFAIQRALIK
jgi:ribonuclease PH